MSDYRTQQREDQERFLNDTKNHRMQVIQDNGLHRHLRFSAPNTNILYYNITTFPGYLVFTGNAGSYTFSRLRDMFEFHRSSEGCNTIDYNYWMEKAESVDKRSGKETFSEEMFRDALRIQFRDWHFEDFAQMKRAWAQVKQELWDIYSLDEALNMTSQYQCDETCNTFVDIWDSRLTEVPFSFRWICWAIRYAIRDYDLGGDKFTRQERADRSVLVK